MTVKLVRIFESAKVRSAAARAARTFLQAFIAQVTLAPLLDANIGTMKAAGIAGGGAVLALIQRSLDQAGVKTIPPG